jgi:hypothetical protein
MHGQPWFAWEWGWDVLFALIHRTAGLAGVGFATVLLLGAIGVLLYKLVLQACGNDVLSFGVTALGLCGSSIHWLARPHLFSWLFLLGYLHLIPSVQSGSKVAFAALPILMLLWVNLHGAFFVGVALLVATAGGDALEALLVRGQSLRTAYHRERRLLVCAALCFAATFVNPYTWRLHRHLFEYLANTKLLDNIVEFQSLSFHHPAAIFFELMLVLAVGAAFWSLRAGRITPALLSLAWAHLALVSARNIPLFIIIASPLVARWLQEVLGRLQLTHYIGSVFKTVSEICEELKPLDRAPRTHLVSGLLVLLMAGLFATGAKGFEAQFNPDSFPIQAIPVVESSPAQRIFTYDGWGNYIIYRLYPKKPTFVDGRSDFYGTALLETAQQILSARYDWKTQLQHFGIDMVVLKPDAPLCAVLKLSPDWTMRFDDGKVLVFEAVRLRPLSRKQEKQTQDRMTTTILERRTQHD